MGRPPALTASGRRRTDTGDRRGLAGWKPDALAGLLDAAALVALVDGCPRQYGHDPLLRAVAAQARAALAAARACA